MSAEETKNKNSRNTAEAIIKEFDSDVLFQRMFDKWYAFSMVDGEMLMAEVPDDKIIQFKHNVK